MAETRCVFSPGGEVLPVSRRAFDEDAEDADSASRGVQVRPCPFSPQDFRPNSRHAGREVCQVTQLSAFSATFHLFLHHRAVLIRVC